MIVLDGSVVTFRKCVSSWYSVVSLDTAKPLYHYLKIHSSVSTKRDKNKIRKQIHTPTSQTGHPGGY